MLLMNKQKQKKNLHEIFVPGARTYLGRLAKESLMLSFESFHQYGEIIIVNQYNFTLISLTYRLLPPLLGDLADHRSCYPG